ncbi:MAG: DUF2157 domain-containing protein [Cyanobacteria bacterium P01_F01_bin.86]
MASDGFRRELQREAQRWREQGLISPDQFQNLAQQYQFEALDIAARDRFIMILLGLGSLLVGIGAITFAVANWQALSQTLKAGGLFIAMMIANLGGFALISPGLPHQRWQRIGQALLLLGALLLGANLALMGQIIPISSTRYEFCAVWALGVLAMAYGVRLTFLGMLALLLLGVGYWSSLWDMEWLQNSLFGIWTLQLMPLIVTAFFLPLAYYCQSQVLFALSAIATVSSLLVLTLDVGSALPAWLEALVLILPYALLWAYDDTLWMVIRTFIQKNVYLREITAYGRLPFASELPTEVNETAINDYETSVTEISDRPFQPVARGLMAFGLSVFYWVFSFHDAWTASVNRGFPDSLWPWRDTWLMLLTLLILGAWTVLSWGYLGWRQQQRVWRLDALSIKVLAFLLVTAAIFFGASVVGPISILATTVFNILLAVTSLGMMREGLGAGARAPFWWGLVMLTLQILSRVLEYETGLLVKSLVFVICGVGIILIGLWFERYVRTLRVDSA